MSQYCEWQALAENVATDMTVFASAWKKTTAIRGILEHVSVPLGKQFLARIAEKYPTVVPLVADVCCVNDSVGDTARFDFGIGRPVGPTSIRYVFHACEVLSRASKSVKIVEVGWIWGPRANHELVGAALWSCYRKILPVRPSSAANVAEKIHQSYCAAASCPVRRRRFWGQARGLWVGARIGIRHRRVSARNCRSVPGRHRPKNQRRVSCVEHSTN